MEALAYDQYLVRVDGSGRLTRRNRRFLRAFKPVSLSITTPQPLPHAQWKEDPDTQRTNTTPHDKCTATESPLNDPGAHDIPMVSERSIIDDDVHNHSDPNISMDNTLPETSTVQSRHTASRQRSRSGELTLPVATSTKSKRRPLALRQLDDYNAPGLKETI